jgi:hypothetical protein
MLLDYQGTKAKVCNRRRFHVAQVAYSSNFPIFYSQASQGCESAAAEHTVVDWASSIELVRRHRDTLLLLRPAAADYSSELWRRPLQPVGSWRTFQAASESAAARIINKICAQYFGRSIIFRFLGMFFTQF